MTEHIRKQVYQSLLARSNNGKLGKKDTTIVAEQFGLHIRAVQRLWKRGKTQLANSIPARYSGASSSGASFDSSSASMKSGVSSIGESMAATQQRRPTPETLGEVQSVRPNEETCGVGGRIGRRGERGERCGAGDLLAIMACGTPARESKRTGAGASKQALASQNVILLPKRPRSQNDFYLGYRGSKSK